MEKESPISFTEAAKLGIEKGVEFNKAVRQRKHQIAERLQRMRFERNITQTKLCEEINVNRITYSGYENERAEPSAEVLVRIAKYYDVSLDYICCRTDNPHGVYSDTVTTQTEDDDVQKKLDEIQKQLDELRGKKK